MLTEVSTRVGIVGSGRVAKAMGRLLRERGLMIAAVAGRNPAHTADAARFIGGATAVDIDGIGHLAGRLLIAVSDDAVAAVAARLAPGAKRGAVAIHTCGVHGVDVLKPLSDAGVHCGALHPLATVPSGEEGLRALAGACYGFTGEEPARAWAAEILELLEGRMYEVPEAGRALYHASAALACNSIPGLLDAAATMLAGSGAAGKTEALGVLERLVRSSLENTFKLGPEAALTGPAGRGDAGTLRLHLKSLTGQDPAIRVLYRALGMWQAELARRAGLDASRLKQVEEALRNE